MKRIELIGALNQYETDFVEELAYIPRFKSLLNNFPNCFERSLITGHITASSWIIDLSNNEVLLVHHRKLGKWLQPGGHADGDENTLNVSIKEAKEETGLSSLKLLKDGIFDIDIHLIPYHKNTQSHFHYDIRYLFKASKDEQIIVNDESNEAKWISLESIQKYSGPNRSITRMSLKTKSIFNSN